MVSILPLVLSLRGPAARPRGLERATAPIELTAPMRAPLTEALLREVMLVAEDLGAEWTALPSGAEEGSLFTATEYEPLFIADLHVRLRNRRSGEELEQHVGVLPRWAVRHVRSGLAEERARGNSRVQPGCRARVRPAAVGEQGVALRVPARHHGLPDVDAIILRRGVAVMALASWPGTAVVTPSPIEQLARTADQKWRRIAELLR